MKINLFVYVDNMIFILMNWVLIFFGRWQFNISKTELLFMVDIPYPLMGPYKFAPWFIWGRVSQQGTINILNWIILCCGTVLCIVGCLAASPRPQPTRCQ